MIDAVPVGLGGVAGALARHLLGERIDARRRDTVAVNVVGSFVLGALLAAGVGEVALLALATGFCGAFTTFSTFALETVRLLEAGDYRAAVVHALANLLGALAAIGFGSVVGTLIA